MRAPLWLVEQACTRKRSYATRAKARAGKGLAERRHGKKMRVYQCRICGGWHLATRREREAEEAIVSASRPGV